MSITFYHTLYNEPVVEKDVDEVKFEEDGIHFHSSGYTYCVEYKYVIKIEEDQI